MVADILYETVRGIAESNPAVAFSNARTIVDLEQSTGLFFEQGLQAWAMGQRVLIDMANFMYVNSHFVMTTGALVWLYLRHNDRFYFVRNMFMVAMGLALVGYVLMPTAPPRFFPELGFVDTIAYYVNVKHDSGLVALFFNPYAAVPSMHVAFALMVAVPAMLVVRNRVAKVLWARVSAAGHVRRARDRQPLVHGRGRGSVRRRHVRAGRKTRALTPLAGCMVVVSRAARGDRVARASLLSNAMSASSGGPRRVPERAVRGQARERVARRTGSSSSGRTAAELRENMRGRLIESRLTPNAISMTGFVLNVVAAVLITQRLFFLAGVAFIVGSLMDTLDGRYSRMSGKGTLFGAFLDSTLDRMEEGIVLTAVAAYFASRGDELAVAATVVVVLGSLMVSYTRARAEALGVECKVGLATRPVRVVLLAGGLLFAKGAGLGDFELLAPAIYAMAGLTVFTVGQRIWHVRQQLAGEGGPPGGVTTGAQDGTAT